MAVEDLRNIPMMGHMLDALENGEDIGHYGRLVFATIGRHFMNDEELVRLLTQDHDADEQEIKALVQQVQEKGYSPPRREKILEHQEQQDFPICPNPDDPDACNPYQDLQCPDEVYESSQKYREKGQTFSRFASGRPCLRSRLALKTSWRSTWSAPSGELQLRALPSRPNAIAPGLQSAW